MTTKNEFEIPLSEFIKKLMWRVMRYAGNVEKGFLFFRNRIVTKVHFDPDESRQLLKDMIINEDNVIRYLRRKYIPTWIENGAIFKDRSCIQKALLKETSEGEKYILIYINKSEPHKIITDTIHVRQLFRDKGLDTPVNTKFYINQIQIAYQDTLLYNLLLTEFGTPPPSMARVYERQLLSKYQKLENVAKIKKRSVKRKFLRWRVKRGDLIWTELRRVINIDDFSETNIKKVCTEIKDAAKERGVKVDF